MAEYRKPDTRDEQIDRLLTRVLGDGSVPVEWRSRHFAAAGQRESDSSRAAPTRLSTARLLPALVVALFAVVTVGVFAYTVDREETDSPISGAAVAKQFFSSPPPNAGRHIVAQVESAYPSIENKSRGIAEVWSRTDEDGQIDVEVLARDSDGDLLGRTVESGDGRWVDIEGKFYRFGSQAPVPPFTSLLRQIRYFIEFDVDGSLIQMDPEALDSLIIEETESDGLLLTTIDTTDTATAEERRVFFEETGTPPGRMKFEIATSQDNGLPVYWKWVIVEESGAQHIFTQINFDLWEELDYEDVDDSHFQTDTPTTAPKQQPSSGAETTTPTRAIAIPAPEDLPFGLHYSRSYGGGAVVDDSDHTRRIEGETLAFVGDQSLAVSVTMFEKPATATGGHDGQLRASFGMIRLDRPSDGGPWSAIWVGPHFQYSLMTYTPPYLHTPPAWSEDDLIRFAEALVAAQQP